MYYRSTLSYQLAYQRRQTMRLPPWVVAAVVWITGKSSLPLHLALTHIGTPNLALSWFSPAGSSSSSSSLLIVSLCLCFGYNGKRHVVLGPNTSRMLAVSSVFVSQVQVSNAAGGALLLHGFPAAPQPSSRSNWTVSKLLSVGSYGRPGFSLWLNSGSVIKIRWDVIDGGVNTENLKVVLFKGERNLELLYEYPTSFISRGSATGEAECSVEEDDSYYIGATNLNPHAVSVSMVVEVSSVVYDVAGATSVCSMSTGPCKMELLFPRMQYAVLVTPAGDGTSNAWYVEISFVARLMAYFGLVGLLAVLLWFFVTCIHGCSEQGLAQTESTPPGNAETDPIIVTRKETVCTYGATEEETSESGSCRSSQDLYDGKLCVICYEERRNCFFTPCGHCVTCHACAKRIMEEENKVCPICRRLIHKVRRLMYP